MKPSLLRRSAYIIFTFLFVCCNSFADIDVKSVQKDVVNLKAFVDLGLKYIKEQGEAKAYKEFSDPKGKFRKENLYLFVFGFNGKVLAHGGDPKTFLGKNLFNAKDKFGTPFFQLFVEAANRGGGVVSYYWPRPDTGVLQYKTSYIAPINDRAFIGAGVYKSLEVLKSQEDRINELKKFVDSGVEYIKQKGVTEAYKEFNNPQGKFRKDDWYIFICDYNGEILSHGGDPKKMIGFNITNFLDEFGTPIFKLFVEAAKSGGGTVSYYWPYLDTSIIKFKTSYIRPIDANTFIGAGYYGT